MTEQQTATGGDRLIEALVAEGVDTVFGVPGIQLDGALDALVRAGEPFRLYSLRHEQAASYMADGYARVTGRPGVAMVVPGPGILNATAGLATAYACSSPVVMISGQIDSGAIGSELGLLHEIRNQSEIISALTKTSELVSDPADIPAAVARAFEAARSGRPRPVGLEIPVDTLHAAAESRAEPVSENAPSEAGPEVEQLVKLLSAARRPVLYAGGGVHASGAHAELLELAEQLGAPVVTSLSGPGAIPADHRLALTHASLADVASEADLVVVIGSRFLRRDGSREIPESRTRIVALNVDPVDLRAPRDYALNVLADARRGLRNVLDTLPSGAGSSWTDVEIADVREALARRAEPLAPQRAWLAAIRAALPRRSYFVSEMTQMGYVANDFYPVYEPRGFISPGYQGTLGYGYATALGAKVGAGTAPVVSVNGDGGFGWTLQELATQRKYGIGLITIVFRDDHFGNVRRIQQDSYDGRLIGVDLCNPDLVGLAESFGIRGERAASPNDLEMLVGEAAQRDEPILIDVPVGELPNPWPIVG